MMEFERKFCVWVNTTLAYKSFVHNMVKILNPVYRKTLHSHKTRIGSFYW